MKILLVLIFSFFLVLPFGAQAQEQLDLTSPTGGVAQRTNYIVDELDLNWGAGRIDIWLKADNGERQQFVYKDTEGDPVATNLMIQLNKADLSANSLHKRIMNQLISDGKLSGTISGTPQ